MAKVKKITSDLRKVVDKQLSLNESIQWMDQPISTVSISDFKFMYFFEIAWTIIFLIVFESKSIIDVIAYIAIFMIILIPLFIHLKSLKTVYLVTNNRAIIIEPNWPDIKFKYLFRKNARKIIGQILNPFHFNFCQFDNLLVKLPVYSSIIKSYSPEQINNFAIVKAEKKRGDIKLVSKVVTSITGQKRTVYFGFFNIENPQQVGQIIKNKIDEHRINYQRY